MMAVENTVEEDVYSRPCKTVKFKCATAVQNQPTANNEFQTKMKLQVFLYQMFAVNKISNAGKRGECKGNLYVNGPSLHFDETDERMACIVKN